MNERKEDNFPVMLIGRQDIKFFDDDVRFVGKALDSYYRARSRLSRNLVVRTQFEKRTRRNDRPIGGFERLAPGVHEKSWILIERQ